MRGFSEELIDVGRTCRVRAVHLAPPDAWASIATLLLGEPPRRGVWLFWRRSG